MSNQIRKVQVLTTDDNITAVEKAMGKDYAATLLVNMLNTYATSPAVNVGELKDDIQAALDFMQQGNYIQLGATLRRLYDELNNPHATIPGWIPYTPDMGSANRVIPRELHQPIIEHDQAGESLETITAWVKHELLNTYHQPASRVSSLTPEAVYAIIRRYKKAAKHAAG